MPTLSYKWRADDTEHELALVQVPGTAGTPYMFGAEPRRRPVEIRDFYMMTTPVTQALWTLVMGKDSRHQGQPRRPVTDVSWNQIKVAGGFLHCINTSKILRLVAGDDPTLRFRLPSETEWEYAARGGPHWTDEFVFSGSNDPDKVAWYGFRFGRMRRLMCRVLGWRYAGRFPPFRRTRTHDVATKAPNQLGIYDMCGNVWEWCEDVCTNDIDAVPRDGSPWRGPGEERRLRGGCHHNWDIHCTAAFRYGIAPDSHDGCIGFRLALGPDDSNAQVVR